MKSLQTSLELHIKKNQLIKKDEKVLVAISGGVDSVVLAFLLKNAGHTLGLAHCNFGLRGQEADDDQKFVENMGQKLNIPVHVKKFNTTQYASDHQVSTQMAARELRYDWFHELRVAYCYHKIATAHHLDDQIETVLFNFTKGTGIAGLRGIKHQTDHMIRPMLFANKAQIIDFANVHNLDWREDESNQEIKYHRNKFRNEIIPSLKEINPGLNKTVHDNLRRYASLEALLNHQTKLIQKEHLIIQNTGYEFDLRWYDSKKGAFAILEETLKTFGFNLNQCIQIAESINNSGSQFSSQDYLLNMDRQKLYISPKNQQEDFCYSVDSAPSILNVQQKQFSISLQPYTGEIIRDKGVAQLDAALVKFPLKVRNWLQGDRIIPLGMTGEKKVSDFMIDEKIPVNLKKKLVLFESNGDIIWIAGHRIDERYKITSKTQSSLIIKMTYDA